MKDKTHLRNFGTISSTGTPLHGTFDKGSGELISHYATNEPPHRPCTPEELAILINAYRKNHTNEVRNNL